MIERLLIQDIERRVKREMKADSFDFEMVTYICDSDSERFELSGDLLYLQNDMLDIPAAAMLTIQSSDNLFTTSKIDFETQQNKHLFTSFRDYIEVSLNNYETFVQFELIFLKITPLINE